MEDRTFVLWRGHQRVNFNEDDLTADRISAVFKVERNGLYLQDDFSRVARFPNSLGNFETTLWRERSSLEVKGSNAEAASTPINFQVPSPHDFGLSSLPSAAAASTSFQVAGQHMPSSSRTPNVSQNALSLNRATKQSTGEIRRKVFLAEIDADSGNPIPTATAYLKLAPEQCTVADVSQLSKEYLNMEDDLVIVDTNGFEILDNPSTRGSEFWGKGTMKMYACREVEYERMKQKRAKMASRESKGKRGRSTKTPSLAEYSNTNLILDKLDDIEDHIQRNAKCCKRLHDLERALATTFKCTICLNILPPDGVEFAGCCQRLVACGECAEEWYQGSSSCPLCRSEEGNSKRQRARGFEGVINLMQSS